MGCDVVKREEGFEARRGELERQEKPSIAHFPSYSDYRNTHTHTKAKEAIFRRQKRKQKRRKETKKAGGGKDINKVNYTYDK